MFDKMLSISAKLFVKYGWSFKILLLQVLLYLNVVAVTSFKSYKCDKEAIPVVCYCWKINANPRLINRNELEG